MLRLRQASYSLRRRLNARLCIVVSVEWALQNFFPLSVAATVARAANVTAQRGKISGRQK